MPDKKPPFVALAAVIVPVLALVITVLVTSLGGSDDGASPPTTRVIDGSVEAVATSTTSTAGGGPGTAAPAGAGGSTTEPGSPEPTTTTAAPVVVEEVASPPAVAGPEGDRTVSTYPQPTVPAGGCRQVSGTAVLELGRTASPGCIRLGASEPLVVVNRTGGEISIVAVSLNEVVPAGGQLRIARIGDAFPKGRSTIWSPGHPDLSSLIEVA